MTIDIITVKPFVNKKEPQDLTQWQYPLQTLTEVLNIAKKQVKLYEKKDLDKVMDEVQEILWEDFNNRKIYKWGKVIDAIDWNNYKHPSKVFKWIAKLDNYRQRDESDNQLICGIILNAMDRVPEGEDRFIWAFCDTIAMTKFGKKYCPNYFEAFYKNKELIKWRKWLEEQCTKDLKKIRNNKIQIPGQFEFELGGAWGEATYVL